MANNQRESLSRLKRGAWIEIFMMLTNTKASLSRLKRGAWIEMYLLGNIDLYKAVAPQARRVD